LWQKGWTLRDDQGKKSEEYDDDLHIGGRTSIKHDYSSSSMPSNMLSMGEDLVDVRRPHGEQRS
jgi:hypothetical protein